MGTMIIEYISNKIADSFTCIKSDELGNCIEQVKTGQVMLWKFKDQYGNLWNTETPIDGTEDDAKKIILDSIQSDVLAPLGLS